jgi:hypothetical protein
MNDSAPTTRARNRGRHGNPEWNQAQKIVAAFGGELAVAKALGVDLVTPYRWQYAAPYGRNGLIPAGMVDRIDRAAAILNITLTPHDWLPERVSTRIHAQAADQTETGPAKGNDSVDLSDLLS